MIQSVSIGLLRNVTLVILLPIALLSWVKPLLASQFQWHHVSEHQVIQNCHAGNLKTACPHLTFRTTCCSLLWSLYEASPDTKELVWIPVCTFRPWLHDTEPFAPLPRGCNLHRWRLVSNETVIPLAFYAPRGWLYLLADSGESGPQLLLVFPQALVWQWGIYVLDPTLGGGQYLVTENFKK